MRLSDIMGHLNLTTYPILALVLFLAVFVGVCVRTFRRGRSPEFRHAASLPLEDTADHGGSR